MARFEMMRGLFGLLPTPYRDDLEIDTANLCAIANFCCASRQHGIVWPVLVGEYYLLGESERIRNLDAIMEEINGRLPLVFGCSASSIPESVLYARAAERAGADAVIAMAPSGGNADTAMNLFRRLAEVFSGPLFVQNADGHAPLTGEQIAQLSEEVDTVRYVKEERQPGPRHIAEVKKQGGDRIKTIFGGAAGRFFPAELSQGADGCMPACELGDILARIIEYWWAGEEDQARDLHCRLLPLINLETHPFMRYILKRRGVLTSMAERMPAGKNALDDADKREISRLLEAVSDEVREFPFGPE